MEFYLDTANLEKIIEVRDMGILAGITTNPTLVAKEGKDYKETVCAILKEVDVPVSVEVLATDWEDMVKEAVEKSKWGKNVVIKIPATPHGFRAMHVLKDKGVKVNCTLIFSFSQGMIAAEAGATYLSPFVGRLDDIGTDGMQLVSDLVDYVNYYHDGEVKVIAASIRHPKHVEMAARAGAHIVTVPYEVLKKCLYHPMTDIGLEKFLKDWKDAEKKLKKKK